MKQGEAGEDASEGCKIAPKNIAEFIAKLRSSTQLSVEQERILLGIIQDDPQRAEFCTEVQKITIHDFNRILGMFEVLDNVSYLKLLHSLPNAVFITLFASKKRTDLIQSKDPAEKELLHQFLDKHKITDVKKFFLGSSSRTKNRSVIKYLSELADYLIYCKEVGRTNALFEILVPLSRKRLYSILLEKNRLDKICQVVSGVVRRFNYVHQFTDAHEGIFNALSVEAIAKLAEYVDIFFLHTYLSGCELERAVQIFDLLTVHNQKLLLSVWHDSSGRLIEIIAHPGSKGFFDEDMLFQSLDSKIQRELQIRYVHLIATIINNLAATPENAENIIKIFRKITISWMAPEIMTQIVDDEMLMLVLKESEISPVELLYFTWKSDRKVLFEKYPIFKAYGLEVLEIQLGLLQENACGDKVDRKLLKQLMECMSGFPETRGLLEKYLIDRRLLVSFMKKVSSTESRGDSPELTFFMSTSEETQLEILRYLDYGLIRNEDLIAMLSVVSEVVYREIIGALPLKILSSLIKESSNANKCAEFLDILAESREYDVQKLYDNVSGTQEERGIYALLSKNTKAIVGDREIEAECSYGAEVQELRSFSVSDIIGLLSFVGNETVAKRGVLGCLAMFPLEEIMEAHKVGLGTENFLLLLSSTSFLRAKEIFQELYKINKKGAIDILDGMHRDLARTFGSCVNDTPGTECIFIDGSESLQLRKKDSSRSLMS